MYHNTLWFNQLMVTIDVPVKGRQGCKYFYINILGTLARLRAKFTSNINMHGGQSLVTNYACSLGFQTI